MSSQFDWKGPALVAHIQKLAGGKIRASAILVAGHAKELLSVAGTGVAKAAMKKGGKKFKQGRRVYGANPSAPGEPPRKQFGHLRRSVTWSQTDLVAQVGTNLLYGRQLELGTLKMKARPWLRRALNERRKAIQALFKAP